LSDLVLSDEAQVPPGQWLFYSPFDEPGSKYVTEWVKAKVKRMGKEPHPFVRATKRTPLAEVARLVIVGDWGTGVGRALDVRDQMRAALDETPDRERHVVHLGDIYFCGWPDEVKKQFQKCWPVHENEAGIHSWCLNGNHDMYAGGDGYFGMLDKDDRFASQDKSSHFSLGNRHWHILGLDTAYEEWSLSNGQVTWALDERKHADFAGARGILLSHHQPFSAYEGNEPTKSGRLLQESAPLLQNNLTTMWLWGHEHRCVVYEPREFGFAGGAGHLPMGACLGHGGVPAKPTRDQREGVAYVLNESVRRGIENFGMMGFAILDLDGAEASLTCVDELGNRKVVKKFAAA
ncbi:MAG: metallophosphoesterase, partial [Verrucomicrobia bacterium]|nr:metallophosphoesterase [Verrucomicrobiota bacterium]